MHYLVNYKLVSLVFTDSHSQGNDDFVGTYVFNWCGQI